MIIQIQIKGSVSRFFAYIKRLAIIGIQNNKKCKKKVKNLEIFGKGYEKIQGVMKSYTQKFKQPFNECAYSFH